MITEFNIPFWSKTIKCSLNITECFKKDSKLGKQVLDFLIFANTAYFYPLQLRLLLDYFGTASQRIEGDQFILPYLIDILYIEKID